MSTQSLLSDLSVAEHPPEAPLLCQLSCLSPDHANTLRETWPKLSRELRYQVVCRLVEMAERDFEMDFGAVFRVALDDEDAEVRTSAVEGLWEDEDVRLVPLLVSRLLDDESADVRAAAAVSLGRFVLLGELQKIRPGPFGDAYGALLACCSAEKEPLVRRRALESLAYLSGGEVESLIEAAYASTDDSTRASAVFAMGRSGHERWRRHVRQELFSPDPQLRFEGARACGELALAETVQDLEELTEDVDPEVREAAISSLGQIGGDRARQVIERLVLSEDEATRTAAEAAWDELEFVSGELSRLLNQLSDGSIPLR